MSKPDPLVLTELELAMNKLARNVKNDALEQSALIAEKFSDQGRDGHQIARALRLLKSSQEAI